MENKGRGLWVTLAELPWWLELQSLCTCSFPASLPMSSTSSRPDRLGDGMGETTGFLRLDLGELGDRSLVLTGTVRLLYALNMMCHSNIKQASYR